MRSDHFDNAGRTNSSSSTGRRFVAVAQDLLEAIERAEFRAGDRLPPDRVLSAEAGVSRATVREALLALELLGVVEIRHGSGVYVLGPSDASVYGGAMMPNTADLFEARSAIEPKVAELCARRLDAREIKTLADSIRTATAAVENADSVAVFTQRQMEFHVILAARCGNAVLTRITNQLISTDEHPLWALVNQHALRTKTQRLGQIEEHARILQAIEAQDPLAAANAMRDHVTDLGCLLVGVPINSTT